MEEGQEGVDDLKSVGILYQLLVITCESQSWLYAGLFGGVGTTVLLLIAVVLLINNALWDK